MLPKHPPKTHQLVPDSPHKNEVISRGQLRQSVAAVIASDRPVPVHTILMHSNKLFTMT